MLDQNNFIKKLSVVKDDLVIDWQDDSQSKLYSLWLRDHCQMPQSRNANNGQRLLVLSTYQKIPLLKRLSKMKEVIYIFGLCLKIIGLSFLRTGYG